MPRLSERDVLRFTHVDHRRPGRVRAHRRRPDDRGRPLRPDPAGGGRTSPASSRRRSPSWSQDAHQGRGIAQLLLEHLAQAGRERGIDRFVADVLPENRRMIQVFREAGYHVAGGYEDGVMRLVFPIDPTDTSRRRDAGPRAPRRGRVDRSGSSTPAASRSSAPRRRHDTIGQTLVRNLVLGDYQRPGVRREPGGPVGGRAAGVRRRVGDIPDTVDVAIVAVPAEAVQDVVLDCAAKGVHGLVVISSGFAETGEEGRQPAAAAGRAGPQLRPAAGRPELPRHHQHRPRRTR